MKLRLISETSNNWSNGPRVSKLTLPSGYILKLDTDDGKNLEYSYIKDGNTVGHLILRIRSDFGVSVIDHGLDKDHRGKGLGGIAITELAKTYGRLHSMDLSHSTPSAKKMWLNIGAKERKTKAGFVYEITADNLTEDVAVADSDTVLQYLGNVAASLFNAGTGKLPSRYRQYTQQQVEYKLSNNGNRRCGTCKFYNRGSCLIVDGRIDENAICIKWQGQ